MQKQSDIRKQLPFVFGSAPAQFPAACREFMVRPTDLLAGWVLLLYHV